MVMQWRRGPQSALVVRAALAISVAAVPARADSLTVGPTDERTRPINGRAPATLDGATGNPLSVADRFAGRRPRIIGIRRK